MKRGMQMDTFSGPGLEAYLRGIHPYDSGISQLPEDIQEQINAHAEEFVRKRIFISL